MVFYIPPSILHMNLEMSSFLPSLVPEGSEYQTLNFNTKIHELTGLNFLQT